MEFAITTENIIGNTPIVLSSFTSLLALAIASWLKFRKVDIEEKTSVGSSQAKQVELLMAQIDMLSEELTKTRKQLSELHEQNVQLMEELRSANRRIGELEILLDKRPTFQPTSF
jgi:peptidoglycan hydrolase CwlO-like protein